MNRLQFLREEAIPLVRRVTDAKVDHAQMGVARRGLRGWNRKQSKLQLLGPVDKTRNSPSSKTLQQDWFQGIYTEDVGLALGLRRTATKTRLAASWEGPL